MENLLEKKQAQPSPMRSSGRCPMKKVVGTQNVTQPGRPWLLAGTDKQSANAGIRMKLWREFVAHQYAIRLAGFDGLV